MIIVAGLGFVGLTTALGFSELGNKVHGVEINEERKNLLKSGKLPFHEEHLSGVLEKHLNNRFDIKNLKEVIAETKIIFCCVGTPQSDTGEADLSYIEALVEEIFAEEWEGSKEFVVKSTIPPGTTEYLSNKYKAYNKENKTLHFLNNPEFLREGKAWEDFMGPDRIIIGTHEDYRPLYIDEVYKNIKAPIYYTNLNTAEFTKYLSNSLLATMISYSNEMSMAAHKIGGIEIGQAFKLLHLDKRWYGEPANMKSYVYPGCGYGGYCLPKDIKAMARCADINGYKPSLLNSVSEVNESVVSFLVSHYLEKRTSNELGILGLSFKPGSDDVRMSPAFYVIEEILKRSPETTIHAYDPIANEEFEKHFPDLKINYKNSIEDLLNNCENVMITTAWEEFKEKSELIKTKNLFDFRYSLE